ncbi:Lsr2 family DNA-binding protein [Streptomyces melanogenes]|uniref:Lsr2 family DNA-binding protein n=1 Tax=Streptomyces melanogenes TaxID=67326 RepID=UPI00167C8056|nr:histone-like nucleoid-structuring protein Lsr2 [Streptomyces melanogenes]GGP72000.1 hypothetical protein GCM10010278_57530 [Streptomyces melanogenes]
MSEEPTAHTVVQFLADSGTPVRATTLLRATGLRAKDLLDLESQGVILGELVYADGPGRLVRLYRLPCAPLDPVAVRAYTVSKGLCEADSPAPVGPPEFRAYESHLQHLDRLAQAQRAREMRQAADTRRQHRRDLVASWPSKRIPRIRAWAEKQRLDVGTRGRLPQWVVDKYDQEVDDQAELQSLLKSLGLSDEGNERDGADA